MLFNLINRNQDLDMKIKSAFIPALASLLLLASNVLQAGNQTAPQEETREQRDARMGWWREARFGMFIHWGVYSIPAGTWNGKKIWGGGEWIMNCGSIPVADYQKLPAQFNPVKFNADEWVGIAKNAGMKYIVITAKHHDGFAMFKSRDPFNIVDATPFKRDVLSELATACRKQGIKLGFYYSQSQDWNHPGGTTYPINGRKKASEHWDKAQDGSMDEYIDKVAVPQVRELLVNYGSDIPAVLWWDTPLDMTKERGARLSTVVNELRPGLIMNNRGGGGIRGDTETPEQHIPPQGYPGKDWETCMTMNGTWGFKSDDNNWKSTETLIHNLCDIASKGGNYLLNVGPTSEGLIPQPSVERLDEVGKWMRVNGEAIYGTGPTPFGTEAGEYSPSEKDNKGKPKFIAAWNWRCTTKPGRLYIHIFKWPAGGKFVLPVTNKKAEAFLLARPGEKLETVPSESGMAIKLPASAPDAIASVLVLEVEGPLQPLSSAVSSPSPH
jgi:alpha-L-fucosidase